MRQQPHTMTRRTLISAVPALALAGSLQAAEAARARFGICSFSCHQHWKAVAAKHAGVKFTNAISFYRYSRELGGHGVQTSLRSKDTAVARELRALVEKDGGYFEGELRLPRTAAEVAGFDDDV